MAQQTINIGTAANDGTGDPIRTAWTKSNANFTELYARPTGGGSGSGTVNSGTGGQIAAYATTGTAVSGVTLGLNLVLSGTTLKALPSSATLTFGTTTTINTDTTQKGALTATGNTTLAVSGTPVDGQVLRVDVLASGASRTVAIPSGSFSIPSTSSVTSPVTVASGTVTKFAFEYSGLLTKWSVVAVVGGYS